MSLVFGFCCENRNHAHSRATSLVFLKHRNTYTKMSAQQQAQGNECPVCLETLRGSGKALFTTACGHEFHFSCIQDSVNRSPSEQCPICRANVPQLAPGAAPSVVPIPQQQQQRQQLPQQQQQIQQRPQQRQRLFPMRNQTLMRRQEISVANPALLEEEPLSPREKSSPASSSSTSSSSSSSADCLKLTVDIEKDRYSCKHAGVLTAIASLKAPKNENAAAERPPCDIVAVVDRSGSMSGKKLGLVKEALSYLLTQLKDNDRLSVVAFDSRVNHIFGLKKCNEKGRMEMDSQIQRNLRASGGTNIKRGLAFGLDTLKHRKTKNAVSAIMLLTDGQGGAPTSAELKAWQEESCVPIHCFGFGVDHDAKTLTNIAEHSCGAFEFIEKLDMVGEAFATCLGGLLSIAAQEVVLKLACENDYSMIQNINTTYGMKMSNDSKSAEITIPDMLSEETKDIVLTVRVRECPENASPSPLFSASGSYTDMTSGKDKGIGMTLSKVYCDLARPSDDSQAVVSYRVDKENNRVLVAEALKEAVRLAEEDQLESARETLDCALKDLQRSISGDSLPHLTQDLKETRQRFETRSAYKQGGYAFCKQTEVSHRTQRGVAGKASYCNSVQMAQKMSHSSYMKKKG